MLPYNSLVDLAENEPIFLTAGDRSPSGNSPILAWRPLAGYRGTVRGAFRQGDDDASPPSIARSPASTGSTTPTPAAGRSIVQIGDFPFKSTACGVTSVSLDDDGCDPRLSVVCCSSWLGDSDLGVLDFATGQPRKSPKGLTKMAGQSHSGSVFQVGSFVRDVSAESAKLLFSPSKDGSVGVWAVDEMRRVSTLEKLEGVGGAYPFIAKCGGESCGFGTPVVCVGYCSQAWVCVHDVLTGKQVAKQKMDSSGGGNTESIWDVCLTSDKRAVSCTSDIGVSILSFDDEPSRTVEGLLSNAGNISTVLWAGCDDFTVVVGSEHLGCIGLMDLRKPREVSVEIQFHDPSSWFRFAPLTAETFVSGGWDGKLGVFETKTGKILSSVKDVGTVRGVSKCVGCDGVISARERAEEAERIGFLLSLREDHPLLLPIRLVVSSGSSIIMPRFFQ